MIDEPDFCKIAKHTLLPLYQHSDFSVAEIVIDKPDDHRFNERTIIIVSMDNESENRENDYHKSSYWYDTLEIIVCGPDKDVCRELCLIAHDMILQTLDDLMNNDCRILGLTRGIKSIGVASFGGVLVDGYCARRTIQIHNMLKY
jgi:hypothetical protein